MVSRHVLFPQQGTHLACTKAEPVAVRSAGIAPTDQGSGVKLVELQRGNTFISTLCTEGA